MSVTPPVRTASSKPRNSDSQSLVLQRTRLLSHPLQRKLFVNEPRDDYEKEADRVADQVMGKSDASVNAGATLSAKTPIIQRSVAGNSAAGVGAAPSLVHDALSLPGRPMDMATREFFEPRFGHDLSHVRIHSDVRAAESARAVNARAYTTGSDIVFGAGQYLPRAQTGQHLLAHELAHVMQGAPGIHRFRRHGEALATEIEEPADEMVEGGDIASEAPSPYDVFLSEDVYDRLIGRYTVDQVYPDLSFLEGEWPFDLGAFYDLLSQHATFVDMAEADFGLIQPQTLSETEFHALCSMAALEEFLRFHHLYSRFLDPEGKFVEPASLQDYRRTLARPGDRAEFGSAQDAIDSFRTRILAYVDPTYSLLLQLSRESVMTASGTISSFHAAMFGLYLQTENPMQAGSGGEMDPLALALEEYAGFDDASRVANLLRQEFRKAYLKGVNGDPALAMMAQAYSDRMGNTRTQPIRSPFSIIRPETVALVNSMFSFPVFDLTTTLNAMPPQAIAVRANAVGEFVSLLKSARNPEGIYAVVRHFESSAIDRTALYRNFLGIEPEWLDVAGRHRYIAKDSSTYRYPPEPPDSSMSQEQWDLATKLEEARSRAAVGEAITGLLAIGASVAAGIVAGFFTGGNPVVAALVASATAAAFGLTEISAAARHITITSAAHMAQKREGLPFGSEELADFAIEEFEHTRQAAITNTLIAAATGGIGGPALGPGAHWIERGLVSMGMGGFDGLASALADPRIMDEDFQRDKVVLMGGDPGSAPTAFEGVRYQVFVSALFGGVTHGVVEGVHFRVAGNRTERPKVSLDGADISNAEVTIVVDPAGDVRVVRDGAEWSHEAVVDLEQTVRASRQDFRTSQGTAIEHKGIGTSGSTEGPGPGVGAEGVPPGGAMETAALGQLDPSSPWTDWQSVDLQRPDAEPVTSWQGGAPVEPVSLQIPPFASPARTSGPRSKGTGERGEVSANARAMIAEAQQSVALRGQGELVAFPGPPESMGNYVVYIFRDRNGRVIKVGETQDLQTRITNNLRTDPTVSPEYDSQGVALQLVAVDLNDTQRLALERAVKERYPHLSGQRAGDPRARGANQEAPAEDVLPGDVMDWARAQVEALIQRGVLPESPTNYESLWQPFIQDRVGAEGVPREGTMGPAALGQLDPSSPWTDWQSVDLERPDAGPVAGWRGGSPVEPVELQIPPFPSPARTSELRRPRTGQSKEKADDARAMIAEAQESVGLRGQGELVTFPGPPESMGNYVVYVFRDRSGRIIKVGETQDLQTRIRNNLRTDRTVSPEYNTQGVALQLIAVDVNDAQRLALERAIKERYPHLSGQRAGNPRARGANPQAPTEDVLPADVMDWAREQVEALIRRGVLPESPTNYESLWQPFSPDR